MNGFMASTCVAILPCQYLQDFFVPTRGEGILPEQEVRHSINADVVK